MKKLFTALITISLLLMPLGVYAQSEQTTSKTPPPVSQPLVPEGDFALKLATALKLGTPASEAQAEDMLTSAGITPRNGWIADYPVTPDIVGELRSGVAAAADAQKLPMGKEEALKAFQDVTAEFGLAVMPGSEGKYAAQPESYTDPTIINNYYYEEGPPVVTYYPPPWDYYYLYAWVPYPFWWGGFFFSGFFCLNDFHRVVIVGHNRFVVTNHVFDRSTRRVSTVDPASRIRGATTRAFADISRNRGFNSTEAKRGASSIFERSRERVNSGNGTSGRGFADRNMVSPRSGGRFEDQASINNRGNSAQRTHGEGSVRQSTPERPAVRDFNRSESSGRFFSAPNRGSERSFSPPSRGGFSCANCHGGSSSFGRSGGGSSSRGFSGGGFSRGGGFSGGRGGGRGR